MSTKSFWFPHDYNACDDVKLLFLRQQLGMEGVGIYWYILERLAQAGGILPLKIVPVLAMQIQVPDVKVTGVITAFDLFQVDDKEFQSVRLSANIKMLETTRSQQSKGGKKGMQKRWGNKKDDDNQQKEFVI